MPASLIDGGIMPHREAMTDVAEVRRIIEVEMARSILEPVGSELDRQYRLGVRHGHALALRVLGGYGFTSFDATWARSIASREASR